MLPAPARIAAAPSPSSRTCWNPAVPPPPVGGAPVGIGVLCVGVGAGLLGELLADGLLEGLGDGLAEGLADGLDEGELGGPVPVSGDGLPSAGVGVAEGLPEDDDVGGSDAEGEGVVQAETAAEMSRAAMAQPAAVNHARSPVRALRVCPFMQPPRGSRPVAFPSRRGAPVTDVGREGAWPTRSLRAPAEGSPVKGRGP
jgi:hypothetical protein